MKQEAGRFVTRSFFWLFFSSAATIVVMFVGLQAYNYSYRHIIPFQKMVDKARPMVTNVKQRDEILQKYLDLVK